MREEGLEPSRPYGQGILSPLRLPIPPFPQFKTQIKSTQILLLNSFKFAVCVLKRKLIYINLPCWEG